MLKKILTLALILCLVPTVIASSLSVYDPNTKTVCLEVGDSQVVIGNSEVSTEFQAHVKMDFWGGEDNIQFFEEGVKGTPALKDEKLKLDLPTQSLEWRKSGNSLKWVTTFKEKPLSNKLVFKLDGKWRDFGFHRQPPFAEKYPDAILEYYDDSGVESIRAILPVEMYPKLALSTSYMECPLYMDGGYVVYHKFKRDYCIGNTNYTTGKVLNIHKSKAVDVDGKFVWVDLLIENGVLTETIPQVFLDSATYPVVVNATFGRTDIGTVKNNSSDNFEFACGPYSPAGDGSATSVSVWYEFQGNNCNVTQGFWIDSGGGTPAGALQRDTADTVVSATGWKLISLDSAKDVLGANTYWIGWNYFDNGGTGLKRAQDTIATFDMYYEGKAYSAGTLSNPYVVDDVANDEKVSVYVTYTPSAAAAGQVIIVNME